MSKTELGFWIMQGFGLHYSRSLNDFEGVGMAGYRAQNLVFWLIPCTGYVRHGRAAQMRDISRG